jgi:hypothetical protein
VPTAACLHLSIVPAESGPCFSHHPATLKTSDVAFTVYYLKSVLYKTGVGEG